MCPCPSCRPAAAPAIARPSNRAAEAAFVAQWFQHLEASRLGTLTQMSEAELATQRANEMAVLGRTPSFPAPILEQMPRPAGWGR